MSRPVRITLFSHKGGIGKTMLTANIAFALAQSGRSVLLVDSDPQCNLTSYLLSDDDVDELLNTSNEPTGRTIWSAVHPVFDSVGVGRRVDPIMVGDVALLPGDIRLSEFEEFLGDAWADSFRRRLGAPARDIVHQRHGIAAEQEATVGLRVLRHGAQYRTVESRASSRFGLLHRAGGVRSVFRSSAWHAGPDDQAVGPRRKNHRVHRAGQRASSASLSGVSRVHCPAVQGLWSGNDRGAKLLSSSHQEPDGKRRVIRASRNRPAPGAATGDQPRCWARFRTWRLWCNGLSGRVCRSGSAPARTNGPRPPPRSRSPAWRLAWSRRAKPWRAMETGAREHDRTPRRLTKATQRPDDAPLHSTGSMEDERPRWPR